MKKICSVDGCGKVVHGLGLCDKHRMRLSRNGHLNDTKRPSGAGTIMKSGHISVRVDGRIVYEHVLVAERALGKRLPAGAQVHHVDLNPANNEPTNLVICPSDAYHKLLHKRLIALNAYGNPDARKCWICKQWDEPKNIDIRGGSAFHRACMRAHEKARYARRMAA